MPEQSLKIHDHTSVAELATFFDGLDDNSQVRARKSGDCIVLYVRGSSNWHFLTDMLRPDSWVKRDYQAAKDKIEQIFSNSNVGPRDRFRHIKVTDNFNECTKNHYNDFYTREIKSELNALSENATNRLKDLNILRRCFEAIPEETKKTLNRVKLEQPKWYDTALSHSGLNDKEKSEKLLGAFVYFALSYSKSEDFVTFSDYKEVLNSADTWLKIQENKPSESGNDIQILKNYLIEFANQIKRHTLSTEIQLSDKKLAESEGDLIISDNNAANSFGSTKQKLTADNEQEFRKDVDDILSLFKVSSLDASNKNAGLKIDRILWLDYEDNNPISDEIDIDWLYEEVGKRIKKNIEEKEEKKEKQASSRDGGKDDAKQSTTSHVIHVTVFNPPLTNALRGEPKKFALSAFARGTSKWLRDNPTLSIHVHASQSIGISDIKAEFQSNLGKGQQRNTEQMPVSQ
jgi:hypothetical protein